MDSPITVAALSQAGGWRTIGGVDPESLTRLSEALFATVLAAQPTSQISGFHVGGGGGGAAWRLTYSFTWGAGPSFSGMRVATSKARLSLGIAGNAADLDRTMDQIREFIIAESGEPPEGVIYDVQIAGGGRDGPYLVAVLWAARGDLAVHIGEEDNATLGPFAVETVVEELTVPAAITAGEVAPFLLDWGGLVNETTGAAGVTLRLYRQEGAGAFVMVREAITSGTGTEWAALTGTLEGTQLVGTVINWELRTFPVGVSTVTVRNVFLHMLRTE